MTLIGAFSSCDTPLTRSARIWLSAVSRFTSRLRSTTPMTSTPRTAPTAAANVSRSVRIQGFVDGRRIDRDAPAGLDRPEARVHGRQVVPGPNRAFGARRPATIGTSVSRNQRASRVTAILRVDWRRQARVGDVERASRAGDGWRRISPGGRFGPTATRLGRDSRVRVVPARHRPLDRSSRRTSGSRAVPPVVVLPTAPSSASA